MDYTNKKRSQKEIFSDAYKELIKFNTDITTYLINDMFQLLTQYQMVLDGLLIRQFGNGNDVAIIRSRIRSQYCGKDYYIPVSILYPISGCDTDHMRIFLIVSKNTTVNKQCSYINEQTNEVLIENLDTWRYTDGLTPVVTILQSYFASICPIFEINPSDVSIPFSELVVKEKLGSGTSADVYRGIYQGRNVALKKMRKIPSQVEYRYLLREFQTQIRFKHSCILEILGHSEAGEGFPVLVMELGGPSLENLIIKNGVKYSNLDKRKFVLDIAMGLEYLHSFNVVHRDIKLANVLLTNGTAKIADFGYAREIENNKSIQVSFCGSPAIMAPELIENAKCSTKVDVYSFGCVLYEIILEKHCYFDLNLKGVAFYQRVLAGLRPTIVGGMPSEPVQLMKQCWLPDKQRPTMKEIVQIVKNWSPDTWDSDVVSVSPESK